MPPLGLEHLAWAALEVGKLAINFAVTLPRKLPENKLPLREWKEESKAQGLLLPAE